MSVVAGGEILTNRDDCQPKGIIVCKAILVLMVVLCMVQAAIMDCDTFAYDISMARAILQMVVSAVGLWTLQMRARLARLFLAIGLTAAIVLSAVDMVTTHVDVAARIGTLAMTILYVEEYALFGGVALYLLFGSGPRQYLTQRMDMSAPGPEVHTWDAPFRDRIRTWEFWRDMGIHFVTFSILGHWAEILFCRLIIAGVFMGEYDPTNTMLWDQWLYPFSAEGTALVMIALFLHPLKLWLLEKTGGRTIPTLALSFLANQLVCTSIDFGTGMVANRDYRLWDYRNMPFNFMGQICLQNSLVYSVAATVIVWWAYPAMDCLLHRLPRAVVDGLFFALVGTYAFLAALYFIVI